MLRLRDTWLVLKETFAEWTEDRVPRLGAALAYYTVFSLAPLLIVAIVIASAVFGRAEAQQRIISQISQVIGQQGAEAINRVVDSTYLPANAGLITIVVGVTTLLLGTLGVFGQLQDAFNTIWEVAPKPRAGIVRFLRARLLSFAMVVVVGFLLLVSLVVNTVMSAISSSLQIRLPDYWLLATTLNLILPFVVTAILFTVMFAVLPDVHLAVRDVLPGAVLTALLFTLGKFAIGFYLGRSRVGTAYGAAGSVLLILVWVYFSAQILFFGAEFTQVYVRRLGRGRAAPSENAVALTEADRVRQGMPRTAETEALAEAAGPVVAPPKEALRPRVGDAGRLRTVWSRYAGALAGFVVGLAAGVALVLLALRGG